MSPRNQNIRPVRKAENRWRIYPVGTMRVPVDIFASEALISVIDTKTIHQLTTAASLPGVAGSVICMPDAHSGYGFPIGCVAGFCAGKEGIISAGGVGYDIGCGVRTLLTDIPAAEVYARRGEIAEALFRAIPAGLKGSSHFSLNADEIKQILHEGAAWAVRNGMGEKEDLWHTEENGCVAGADAAQVSTEARQRLTGQLGTLGSGNHYLEIQIVDSIHDTAAATHFGLAENQIAISIHSGSRGTGHQIATDYIKAMQNALPDGHPAPDPSLAYAPLTSDLGRRYLAAMKAGRNCALANRQTIAHMVRKTFLRLFPSCRITQLYDVSHNTCNEEHHVIEGQSRRLFVHRKGATRALPSGHAALGPLFDATGQPVLVGGSMGTASWILCAARGAEASMYSANHGAGRLLSRAQARKRQQPQSLMDALKHAGISVRTHSPQLLAEEAPLAYKDVDHVTDTACATGIARKVARLRPLICIKG